MRRQAAGEDGDLEWGWLSFSHPLLATTPLPYFEVRSATPGPRLAVVAGMHPNEVSSMEAALRLKGAFAGQLERGAVSMLPILNMPGLYAHADTICPVDGKNINFCFPGSRDGTFSDVLATSLIQEWSADADVFVDLHGGDLREDVAKFVMCQMTGDVQRDARSRELARCFDADLVIEFPPGQTTNTGRAINVLPTLGRYGVMSEAGTNGRIDQESVAFHVDGVLDIARMLGLVGGPRLPRGRANRTLRGYEKILSPAAGRFYRDVAVNDQVSAGQRLAVITGLFGEPLTEMRAPLAGRIVMTVTHNVVEAGDMVFGIGEVVGE